MIHFAEISQAPPSYSILQHVERVVIDNEGIDNEGMGIGLRIYVRHLQL